MVMILSSPKLLFTDETLAMRGTTIEVLSSAPRKRDLT